MKDKKKYLRLLVFLLCLLVWVGSSVVLSGVEDSIYQRNRVTGIRGVGTITGYRETEAGLILCLVDGDDQREYLLHPDAVYGPGAREALEARQTGIQVYLDGELWPGEKPGEGRVTKIKLA